MRKRFLTTGEVFRDSLCVVSNAACHIDPNRILQSADPKYKHAVKNGLLQENCVVITGLQVPPVENHLITPFLVRSDAKMMTRSLWVSEPWEYDLNVLGMDSQSFDWAAGRV